MSPPVSLNVISLISGGKDSLFSLLHCLQNGHHIVALANMYPTQSSSENGSDDEKFEREDLNSFMYQTVGHSIVPLYEEALDLPLYRHKINGAVVNMDRDYLFAEGHATDETEDLMSLLGKVKERHPEANAVSSGAILSTYQRTRIESVATRLQLVSLAYLWQYPILPPSIERLDSISGLLDDMEAAGCDARLIKVASAGIKEKILWSRVSDPRVVNRLVADILPFSEGSSSLRSAIVGEGGEYETLAINGPPRVWKKQINVQSRGNDVIRDEGGAFRFTLGRATVVEQQQQNPDTNQAPIVRVPALLDDRFHRLQEEIVPLQDWEENMAKTWMSSPPSALAMYKSIFHTKSGFTLNNVMDPDCSPSATEQTISIMKQLHDETMAVKTSSKSTHPHIIFTTVLLRNMSDFASVNDIYGKHFNHIHPPARVTICCGDILPEGVLVRMSFTAIGPNIPRPSGLHVQSISYWAPANIGPYSQAINVRMSTMERMRNEMVHIAGQISLVPRSMQLLDGNDVENAVLSLQHLWRQGQCVGVDWWVFGVAYLAKGSIEDVQRRARTAWQVWKRANDVGDEDGLAQSDKEEEEILDAWDLKHNHQMNSNKYQALASARSTADSNLHHTLPNANVLARSRGGNASPSPTTSTSPAASSNTTPPFLAAHMQSLPYSSPIEWHSLGLAQLPRYPSSAPRLQIRHETYEHFSICVYSWQRQQYRQSRRARSKTEIVSPGREVDHEMGPDTTSTDADTDIDTESTEEGELPGFFTIQIFSPTTTTITTTTTTTPTPDLNTLLTSALTSTLPSQIPHPNHQDNDKDKPLEAPDPSHHFNSLTIYTTPESNDQLATILQSHHHTTPSSMPPSSSSSSSSKLTAQEARVTVESALRTAIHIPCLSLWGEEGRRLLVAVRGQIHGQGRSES